MGFFIEFFDPREWDRPTQTYALQMTLFMGAIIALGAIAFSFS